MVCSMLLLWWYSSITFRPTQWLNLCTALYWRWKTVTTSNEVQSTAAFQSFLWEASWSRVMVPNTAMTLSLLYHNILLKHNILLRKIMTSNLKYICMYRYIYIYSNSGPLRWFKQLGKDQQLRICLCNCLMLSSLTNISHPVIRADWVSADLLL